MSYQSPKNATYQQ
jgi:hypothetical protein